MCCVMNILRSKVRFQANPVSGSNDNGPCPENYQAVSQVLVLTSYEQLPESYNIACSISSWSDPREGFAAYRPSAVLRAVALFESNRFLVLNNASMQHGSGVESTVCCLIGVVPSMIGTPSCGGIGRQDS